MYCQTLKELKLSKVFQSHDPKLEIINQLTTKKLLALDSEKNIQE